MHCATAKCTLIAQNDWRIKHTDCQGINLYKLAVDKCSTARSYSVGERFQVVNKAQRHILKTQRRECMQVRATRWRLNVQGGSSRDTRSSSMSTRTQRRRTFNVISAEFEFVSRLRPCRVSASRHVESIRLDAVLGHQLRGTAADSDNQRGNALDNTGAGNKEQMHTPSRADTHVRLRVLTARRGLHTCMKARVLHESAVARRASRVQEVRLLSRAGLPS
jgi:hypothetical protein